RRWRAASTTTTSASPITASRKSWACVSPIPVTARGCARSSIAERLQTPREESEIHVARQAMVAILDENRLHIIAGETVGQGEAGRPGHFGIPHAVQQADRPVDGDGVARDQMLPPLLDEPAGEEIALGVVGRGQPRRALLPDAVLDVAREARPHEILG